MLFSLLAIDFAGTRGTFFHRIPAKNKVIVVLEAGTTRLPCLGWNVVPALLGVVSSGQSALGLCVSDAGTRSAQVGELAVPTAASHPLSPSPTRESRASVHLISPQQEASLILLLYASQARHPTNMGHSPARGRGHGHAHDTQPPPTRDTVPVPVPEGASKTSPAAHHRADRAFASSAASSSSPSPPPAQAANRRALARSVTGFLCRLRPSRRPERGGTMLAATEGDDNDDAGDRQTATTTRRRTASRASRGAASSHWKAANCPPGARYRSDVIPPGAWNTAATLPRRANSTGSRSRRRKTGTGTGTGRRVASGRQRADDEGRRPAELASHTQTPPPRQTDDEAGDDASARSRELFRARRELRRQRRSLKASGDFLGVTGVNPYTGEMDVMTPPSSGSSEDAVTTASSSSLTTNNPGLAALARTAREARESYEQARRRARWEREERRLSRAEQRKAAVREMLQQQQVRWRCEEGGWSSVVEPRLSPIPQSQGSATPESQSRLGGSVAVARGPGRSSPFLGIAAVAGVEGSHRRCIG